MKVLFIFSVPSGGMGTLNRLRVRALRMVGIEGHLLYFQPGSGSGDIEPDIPVFYTPDHGEIGRLLHVHKYDAVVMTSFFLLLPVLRGVGFGGPIIFENQGFGTPAETRENMLQARPYINGNANALLYTGTAQVGNIYREIYPHIPQFAFPNLFDADAFTYLPSHANPDRPVLAWIGRLERNKNWRDYLQIGANAAQYVPNLHLWMFTDPSLAAPGEAEQFEQLKHHLNLTARITHYSNIPHSRMPDYLSRVGDSGGALIMTSKGEGGPYAAVEAISCRCPVVTTDSDGVRSAIIDEVTGLYYPHGDIAAGAAQVHRLIADAALRQRLLLQGISHIRHHLSPAAYAANFAAMMHALGVV